MKAAFSAQYNRHFVSAGVEKTKYLHPELVGAARSASQAAGSVLQSISGSTSNGRDQKDGIDSVDNISESGSTDMLGTFVAPIPPAIPANSAPTLNNTYPSQSHSSSSSTEAKRKRSRWD
ncbi:unnamed protein product [Protopolystoma xenopodis]|uniref:Uncharacterized protein n=1 Tax=Protopolystoma xenopodis TaxID=117903 RepID=A0A3S5CGS0_9PLAT|nr:unnamed protein product [Protopolystoma xenopodis]